jgi:ATP-dependent Zn protease
VLPFLQVSSGATDDLRQATNMARHMVMQCGLNDAVGPVFIEDGDMKGLSEGLRQQVDEGEWLCVFLGGGVLMRSSGVVEGACCL